MKTELKISFQGSDPSAALRRMIEEHVEALEHVHGRLTACHVVIRVPDKHHRSSGLYSANSHLTLPGGIDINVEGMANGDAVHAGDLELPVGSTLAVEPEVLVLHVIAAPTAAQIEAELGEGAEDAEAAVPQAAAAPAAPPAPPGESEGE